MRTYCVLLHVFAALLLCDYGMFSTPSPSTSEMPTDAISSISDSNTTVTTAKSITVGNGLSTLESGLGQNQSNDLSSTTESSTDLSESGRVNGSGSIIRVISSTARPESTTRDVKHHTTQKKPEPTPNIGAIIILIIILILIGILLGILYCLRKKGRSYSFDLTRVEVAANDYVDTPLRSNQQGISYEQTNKDLPACLDYLQEDKSEEKTNPIANGSIGEKTEQTPTNENDEQNVPEENSFSSNSSLATPGYMKKVEFNLDLDLLGGESDFNDSIDAEATDTAQNENNNNVSNAGRGTAEEIFTEISLDEPK